MFRLWERTDANPVSYTQPNFPITIDGGNSWKFLIHTLISQQCLTGYYQYFLYASLITDLARQMIPFVRYNSIELLVSWEVILFSALNFFNYAVKPESKSSWSSSLDAPKKKGLMTVSKQGHWKEERRVSYKRTQVPVCLALCSLCCRPFWSWPVPQDGSGYVLSIRRTLYSIICIWTHSCPFWPYLP